MSVWFSPIRSVTAAVALSLCAAAPLSAADSSKSDAVTYVDAFGDSDVESFKAQIVTTNKMENQIVVKLPNRDEFAVPVPPGFPLNQVRENQFLTLNHLQGVILDVEKSSADKVGATFDLAVELSDPDKLPEGLVLRKVALTAEILEINHGNGTVTFEAPDGEKRTVKVKNPDLIKKLDLKPHDFVVLSFYDAVGLDVSNT